MKKLLFLVFIFFLPGVSFSQPSISFDSENHDMGILTQRDLIEHIFEFSNNGNEDLVIERLVPS